jgi:5-oxoprolinase (ATP-hydrolysing)
MTIDQLKEGGMGFMKEQFEAAHEQLFTYRLPVDIEIMNLRIVAEEQKAVVNIKQLETVESSRAPSSAISGTSQFVYEGNTYESPIWERSRLLCGHFVTGPCIVTEMDSNTVILPGFKAEIDHVGNILIWKLEGVSEAEISDLDEVDPVSVDIIENALRNARNEMDTLMTRASMSPAIREQQDEFNVIAEPGGKMIAGQFGSFIGQFLEAWEGSIEEGDIFITNDPYSVAGAVSHLNDWLVLMPIYVKGKLIAWTSNFGHMTDGGGAVPGSLPTAASSIFEEGIQIPLTKLATKGIINDALISVMYRNCRLPEWNRADTHALIAACKLAGKRMIELYERFGDKTYFAAIEELLIRNHKAIADIIKTTIPDEPVYMEDWIDDDGKGIGPWKVACTMSKKAGKLRFDFTGTYPQSPSSINYYLSENMFKMFIGIYLITVFDPNTVVNDGFHDLVETYIPKGTILNPVRPAASSCRTHLLGRVMDVVSGLLGQKTPEFMTAGGFSDSPHFMYSGWRADGSWFQLYQIGFGGIPARPVGDGMDGHCLWPGMKSVPNEFLELYYPLRLEIYDTVADSGGAGFHRGGNAQRIAYRFLEEGEVSIHDDRWLSKPWGVLGGEPGARSKKILYRYSVDATNPPIEHLRSKQDHVVVHDGDVLEYITWGGGGWGDPLTRDAAFVALEVHRGLVTFEGAKRYGVVVAADFSVDEAATTALRAEMKKIKKPVPEGEVFNRGGSLEELAASALAETGVAAPKHPGSVLMRGPHVALPYVRDWVKKHEHLRKD